MTNPPANEGAVKASNHKKFLISFLIIFLLLSVSAFSYFLGKTQSQNETSFDSPDANKKSSQIETAANNKNTATSTPTPFEEADITPAEKTQIILSISALDGYRSSNNFGNNSQEIKIGRNTSYVARGFVSFELSDLPLDAKIKEAKLRMYQVKITGNPFSFGRQIKVDHLTYGDNLDVNDYGMAALTSSVSALGKLNTLTEWKEADVTQSVRDDLANARSNSQFRIHFQTEVTGGTEEGDFVHFESGENTLNSNNVPELIIKYN